MMRTSKDEARPHPHLPTILLVLVFAGIQISAPGNVAARGDDEKSDPAEAARLQKLIADEVAVQSSLLTNADADEDEGPSQLEALLALEEENGGAFLGKRETPVTPTERQLPRAIFDESTVTIEARTWDNPKKLRVLKLVLDADRDGHPEVIRYLERKTLRPLHQEEDRDYDLTLDSWKDYDEEGRIRRRALDTNDDGRPDRWEVYAKGRMVESSADRDDDGVVDSFYRYSSTHISEEKHDSNNDSEIDLIIYFKQGRRHRAEEDRDHDGRFDTWTQYSLVDGTEMVTRIERDKRNRGYADTFEIFETVGGRSILSRREEDMNGDGKIDMVSIYTKGKLVRREIYNPEVVSL